jgi:hypothetical protein
LGLFFPICERLFCHRGVKSLITVTLKVAPWGRACWGPGKRPDRWPSCQIPVCSDPETRTGGQRKEGSIFLNFSHRLLTIGCIQEPHVNFYHLGFALDQFSMWERKTIFQNTAFVFLTKASLSSIIGIMFLLSTQYYLLWLYYGSLPQRKW